MKSFSLSISTLLAAALLAAPACKSKEQESKPAPTAPAAGSAQTPAAAPTPATEPDHITALAHHQKPKPTDPVKLDFERFKVTKANFDPKTVEGGTATIELDLSSFKTNSEERDNHLKSPSYLDVGKLATATIDIANVKHTTGESYSADATVSAHGMTKTYPVTFDVLERKDDSIRIKGSHTFSRLDFGIGTDPAQNAEESVGSDVTIEMVVTLSKT